MGDDLNFAQKFTRTAADGLALLVEMENPRAAHEAAVVIDMMTTVQRGAKRLRARHIYSGAQGVLSALHHDDDATLEGRIANLGSLVTQYAHGLNELLEMPGTAAPETTLDKWEQAREALNTLLPLASADDADMLSRLMRAPVTIDAINSHEMGMETLQGAAPEVSENGIVKNEITENNSDENISNKEAGNVSVFPLTASAADFEPISASAAPLPSSLVNDEPSILLDTVMRDMVADALSIARTVGRTISLSYDMGERTVSEHRAVDLRRRLGQTLSQIIRQSMTEGRIGHIDINLAGEQLHILAGTTAVRVAIDPQNAPNKTAPKPRITPATEPNLREQLDALMDPVSLHETAS